MILVQWKLKNVLAVQSVKSRGFENDTLVGEIKSIIVKKNKLDSDSTQN